VNKQNLKLNRRLFFAIVLFSISEMFFSCSHNRKIDNSDSFASVDNIDLIIKGDGPIFRKTTTSLGRMTVQTANHYIVIDSNNIVVDGNIYDRFLSLSNIVVCSNAVMIDNKTSVGKTNSCVQKEPCFSLTQLVQKIHKHHVVIKSHIYAGIRTDIFGRKYIRMGNQEIQLSVNYILCNTNKINIPSQSHLVFTDQGVYCQPLGDKQHQERGNTDGPLILKFSE